MSSLKYKQLIDPQIYEGFRKTLISIRECSSSISDLDVEKYFEGQRKVPWFQGHSNDEEFKELIEFSFKCREYGIKLQLKRELPSFRGVIEKRIYIIDHMHKHGHSIPSLLLGKVRRYQRREVYNKMQDELFVDLLSRYKVDCKGILIMYDKYKHWYQDNFPDARKPPMPVSAFINALEAHQKKQPVLSS